MSTAAAAAASSDVQERQRNVLTGSSTRPDQYETPYAGTSDSAVQLSVSTGTPSARASNRPSDRRMSPGPADAYLAEKAPMSLKSVPSLVPGSSSVDEVMGTTPSAKLRGSI